MRLLFVIAHSTDAPGRAATALAAAAAAAQADHQVACWLTDEGVRLAVSGVAEVLGSAGGRSATTSLEALAAAGAELHTSRPCFEARQFEPDVLRPEARLVELRVLSELVAAGWIPVPA